MGNMPRRLLPRPHPSPFGAALRAARGTRSQANFAAMLGYSQRTISAWERGTRRPSCVLGSARRPDLVLLAQLSWLLGLSQGEVRAMVEEA